MILRRTATSIAIIALGATNAFADMSIKDGTGAAQTLHTIDASNTGTTLCGGSVKCSAAVTIDLAGAPFFVTGNPGFVTNNGTFAVQAAESGTWTFNPATASSWGLFADNAAFTIGTSLGAPVECEFTTGGATAITSAHVGAVGCTAARGVFTDKSSVNGTALGAVVSNLGTLASGTPAAENVNAFIVGGAAGGTAGADAATWTAGTTNQTPSGCEFTSGGATAIVTGHMGTAGCTAARAQLTDKSSVGGTAIVAATSAYGTAPTGTAVEGVNAFVTNTNANGQATAANSSPVVLPVAQVTVDPCTLSAKTNLPVSTNATTLTQIIAASGSNKIYICSIALIAPGATAFNLNTGTATNCGTSTAALIGSTTAANGMSFAANGGITLGNGTGTVAVSAASSALCTLQSNAVQVAGNITYVQAP